MDFDTDLDVFFDDFSLEVVFGEIIGFGILDSPDSVLGDNQSISTEYALTVKASEFGSLRARDEITVDGIEYVVRDFRLLDDGKIGRALLSKV